MPEDAEEPLVSLVHAERLVESEAIHGYHPEGFGELSMRAGRMRILAAGVIAFFIGVPLTEKAFGQAFDIVDASVRLGLAIADSAGNS
jgi:hypothetical protein